MEKIEKIRRPEILKDLTYDNIKRLIDSGQIESDVIYSANHFADMLGVSRTPAREALLKLAAEGYFEAILGRGFKVKNFSYKEIEEFAETRKMIEIHVVERVAEILSKHDLKQIENHLKMMKKKAKEESAAEFIEADKKFHMSLIHRYNNSFLESIMINIRGFISITGKKVISHQGRFNEVINEHEMILKALYERDKKRAAKAMQHHLDNTEKYLLETPEDQNELKRIK